MVTAEITPRIIRIAYTGSALRSMHPEHPHLRVDSIDMRVGPGTLPVSVSCPLTPPSALSTSCPPIRSSYVGQRLLTLDVSPEAEERGSSSAYRGANVGTTAV